MGCAKNVVDSEKLLAQLQLSGVDIAPTLEEADIALINTCGFITAAKEESLDVLISLVNRKATGKLRKVYAMGCLTERYRKELRKEIPEVDAFFGTHELPEILERLGATYQYELLGERLLTTPTHSAYLKISEGCDHPCSFCAIPIMRGGLVSRPKEQLLQEVHLLAEKGVKEVVVIAQDTTSYGLDLYGRRALPQLLERIADVQGIEWVRLMYAYPAKFPLEMLDLIGRHPKLCKYLDIPIQHVSDRILKSMRRGSSQRAVRMLLETVRERVPEIAVRTTLIVGYPTETHEDFDELLRFVQAFRFERLGVFTYSREDGTAAWELGDPVPQQEKERRKAVLMELQQEISERKNEELVGTTQRVIIDRQEQEVSSGRTQWDAPEIDNEVLVHDGGTLNAGEFYDVEIVGSYEYDLEGRVHMRRQGRKSS